jgi:HSP20 family protein
MNTSFLPLKRRGDKMAVRRENDSPVMAIQNEMNRLFDQFFADPFTMLPIASSRFGADFTPRVDVSESDTATVVTAELPGMDEKDIQIEIDRDALVISGEKKNETEEKSKNYHRIERSFGSFQRVIPLMNEVDDEKVEAIFKNGILTVTIPKPVSSQKTTRKISIKTT